MTDYHLECPDNCSLRLGTPYGQLVSDEMVAGTSYRVIARIVEEAGGRVPIGTMSRHKKHLVAHRAASDPEPAIAKVNNIEILEAIIQKGFSNQKNWKPTINDTMKAMDMWFKLTQGNPFDELLDTLAAASLGEEADPALGTPDETLVDDDPEG